ncbi:antibiotic ABC transporter permease [Candidatus Saccharibacteria bacterium]|nr:MAG: antibiotic ABC transporter permease [Candidatus Saccharibacteria bacterium]
MMKAFITAQRVIQQLLRDRRTLILVFAIPPLLLWLLKHVFHHNPMFNQFAPLILGIFPMTMMFLISSIVTLKERRDGTLARLMSLPMAKVSFLLGYALAFSIVASIQAAITALFTIYVLDVPLSGGTGYAILAATMSALLGTSLGLFTSAFARTEFQAVQFMPAVIFPQILLSGLLVPRDKMAPALEAISDFLPLTYGTDLMHQVAVHSDWTTDHTTDLTIIVCFVVGLLVLGAATIRRRERA